MHNWKREKIFPAKYTKDSKEKNKILVLRLHRLKSEGVAVAVAAAREGTVAVEVAVAGREGVRIFSKKIEVYIYGI